MKHMQVLLVEDESQHRFHYKEYISTLKYPTSFYFADGEAEAQRLVQMFPFDIIILDLELHESDGDGLEFLKKLKHLNLKEIPYIIVISNNNSPKTRQRRRLYFLERKVRLFSEACYRLCAYLLFMQD